MMTLVWAALVAALPIPVGRYQGRHRMGWAQQWEEMHAALPWQRARRRLAAVMRARRRPGAHSSGRSSSRPPRPDEVSWAWWQARREQYRPALTAAGAW